MLVTFVSARNTRGESGADAVGSWDLLGHRLPAMKDFVAESSISRQSLSQPLHQPVSHHVRASSVFCTSPRPSNARIVGYHQCRIGQRLTPLYFSPQSSSYRNLLPGVEPPSSDLSVVFAKKELFVGAAGAGEFHPSTAQHSTEQNSTAQRATTGGVGTCFDCLAEG